MNYTANDDIIISVDSFLNIKKGEAQIYELTIFKDYLNNQLNANNIDLISVAVLTPSGTKALLFSNKYTPGISDTITIGDSTTQKGVISFEISESMSADLKIGDLNIQVTLLYSNYYPNAKTYKFSPLKIGYVAASDTAVVVDPTDTSGSGTPTGTTLINIGMGAQEYKIQHTNGSLPTINGNLSTNSNILRDITSFTYRMLDINLVRMTILENFLINRISGEGASGTITIFDKNNKMFYTIYKIIGWKRVDISIGNGNTEDSDGIIVYVSFESSATGPGISKSTWEVGDQVYYALDSYGTDNAITPPTGILTYVDKNIQCQFQTNGNTSPTGVRITYSPFYDSYITVEINGISVEIGNGIKTSSAYFSADSGITALTIEEIRGGDQLIWNGDIAGFELEIGDDINLIYEALADDIR